VALSNFLSRLYFYPLFWVSSVPRMAILSGTATSMVLNKKCIYCWSSVCGTYSFWIISWYGFSSVLPLVAQALFVGCDISSRAFLAGSLKTTVEKLTKCWCSRATQEALILCEVPQVRLSCRQTDYFRVENVLRSYKHFSKYRVQETSGRTAPAFFTVKWLTVYYIRILE